MVKTDFFKQRQDGVNLVRTYSDTGYIIKQNETDTPYDEAIDVGILNDDGNWVPVKYSYSETDEKIENNPNEATEEDLYNALSELGVKNN